MSRVVMGAVLLAAFVLGCPPGGTNIPVTLRPECPRDSIVIKTDTGYKVLGSIAGSGPISMVPEYHDCQRMIKNDMKGFGPMIAVFARYGLDTMPNPPQSPAPVRPTARVDTTSFAAEQAAATILNYDEPYDPLHIESGFNCLYVYAVGSKWNAHIVKVSSDSACLKPFSKTMPGFDLKVTLAAIPNVKQVPPVARWDWDKEAHENYIGMRCGNSWCEISSPSHPTLVSSDHYTGSPMQEVKGWYDEQYLAIPKTAPNDLVPGTVKATIFPVGDLSANTLTTFDKAWKEVAIVSLSEASPQYLAKFNFVAGPAPAAQTHIWFCNGTAEGCQIPNGQVPTCKDMPVKSDPPWWAKIVSGTVVKYHCVVRRTHPGVSIPGATRWRWKLLDEGIWVACPEGCCEVTDK